MNIIRSMFLSMRKEFSESPIQTTSAFIAVAMVVITLATTAPLWNTSENPANTNVNAAVNNNGNDSTTKRVEVVQGSRKGGDDGDIVSDVFNALKIFVVGYLGLFAIVMAAAFTPISGFIDVILLFFGERFPCTSSIWDLAWNSIFKGWYWDVYEGRIKYIMLPLQVIAMILVANKDNEK